jgi:hypothetical protein
MAGSTLRSFGPVLCLVTLVTVLGSACRKPPEPIQVERGRVSILNQTPDDWVDVEVRVNRYYLAKAPGLKASGRLDAPLNRFQGGFGRYLDQNREQVRRIDVTARTVDGRPVTLTWQATDRPGE